MEWRNPLPYNTLPYLRTTTAETTVRNSVNPAVPTGLVVLFRYSTPALALVVTDCWAEPRRQESPPDCRVTT